MGESVLVMQQAGLGAGAEDDVGGKAVAAFPRTLVSKFYPKLPVCLFDFKPSAAISTTRLKFGALWRKFSFECAQKHH